MVEFALVDIVLCRLVLYFEQFSLYLNQKNHFQSGHSFELFCRVSNITFMVLCILVLFALSYIKCHCSGFSDLCSEMCKAQK